MLEFCRSIQPWLQRKVESWDPGYRQILQSPEDRDKVNNLVRMSIKFFRA